MAACSRACRVELGPVHPLARRLLGQAHGGIDVDPGDGVRVGGGHLFDLDAALGGEHPEVELGRPVEGEAGVVLLLNVGGVLHPEPLHHMALDVEPEDVAGMEADLVRVGSQLDPARLASASHLHLRLDDHRVARRLGLLDGLVHRVGHPARRRRDAESGEVLLALVLVEVHFAAFSLCRCRCVGVAVSCRLGSARRRREGRAGAAAGPRPERSDLERLLARVEGLSQPRSDGVERRPGGEHLGNAVLFENGDVGLGDDPSDHDEHVATAGFLQPGDHPGHQREVGPGEEREPDGVGILLHDSLDHLLGGLVQAGVDDLEPAVAQRTGDDLGAPVVTVETRLGHDHPVGTFHDGPRIRTPSVPTPDRIGPGRGDCRPGQPREPLPGTAMPSASITSRVRSSPMAA